MPKIIESVREQLLEAAREQIVKNGYKATTVRSVAAQCGIAVGTVYNYFPSKDVLIASFMAEDWQRSLNRLNELRADDFRTLFLAVCDTLREFSVNHEALFHDEEAARVYGSVYASRHGMLRGQIAALIRPYCDENENPSFLSQFVAEAALNWTQENVDFETLYNVIEKLI